jgi:cell pole-organizing protein PopZ
MEEILASIRRIIADDQALPLAPRPSSPNLRPVATEPERPPVPSVPLEPLRRGLRPTLPPEGVEAEFTSQLAATLSTVRGNAAKPTVSRAPQSRSTEKLEQAMASAEVEPAPTSWDSNAETSGGRAPPAQPANLTTVPEAVFGRAEEQPQSEIATPAIHDDKLLSPSADASVASSFNVLATTMFIQNSGVIEQSVREMLRPMLQRWLDDNLPTMVERLVRAEIERVARGGRG